MKKSTVILFILVLLCAPVLFAQEHKAAMPDCAAEVINELVGQRTMMREEMAKMQPEMMQHMMEHMQAGMKSMHDSMECPMMKPAAAAPEHKH